MKKKVLVVDDVDAHRACIKSFLLLKSFDVADAKDGVEALNKSQTQTFDAVFTDIEMPNMNGLELLTRLRRNDKYKRVPIIVVSSVNNPAEIDRAFKLGATAYIVKPYTVKKIADVLQQLNLN